jgi:5-oxoprolinase (ATP-hydrolysing)
VLPLDEAAAARDLRAAFDDGFRSVAIVLMHGYRFPQHEQRLGAIARAIGFTQVSISHETSPLMRPVSRGDTTVVDAYLSPILRRYVDQVARDCRRPLQFMQSSGGLTDAHRFQGKDAILSGPAGGIVGAVQVSSSPASTRSSASTWAARRRRHALRRRVRARVRDAGRRRAAARADDDDPHGCRRRRSICRFDGRAIRVGPESAGANPGPGVVSSRRTADVTDCNVMVGKLHPDLFPKVSARGDSPAATPMSCARSSPAGREDVRARLHGARGEIAAGFLRIAVDNMRTRSSRSRCSAATTSPNTR